MTKSALKTISIEKLSRGRYQPRREFDPELLAELAQSIQAAGLLQPLVVRPLGDSQYEIVAGERRWRAAQLAGLGEISCLVRDFSDEQAAEAATIENINRVDLNPIEEARAYQRMIDEFGYLHEEIAATVGKSRAKISNTLRLLRLEPRVQDLLTSGAIKDGHGKALAGLPEKYQFDIAEKCAKGSWSVRKLEQAIKKFQDKLRAHKPVNINDPNRRALEKKLSDHVGCTVKIDEIAGKGHVQIHFQNNDILQGILQKMGFNVDEC